MSKTFTKSEWDNGCKAFDESRQTKISYCRTHDLNYHQFLYWFEKLNKSTTKLIPVKMAGSKPPLAILRLNNGLSLEIVSQDALLALVRDTERVVSDFPTLFQPKFDRDAWRVSTKNGTPKAR